MAHLVYNGDETHYQEEDDINVRDMVGENVEKEIDRAPNISARLIKNIAEEAGYHPGSSKGKNFPPSPKSKRMFNNIKENVVKPNAEDNWSEYQIKLQAHSTCEEFGRILYDNRHKIANKAESNYTQHKNRGGTSVIVDAVAGFIPLGIGEAISRAVDYSIDYSEQKKLENSVKKYLRRAAERHSDAYQ